MTTAVTFPTFATQVYPDVGDVSDRHSRYPLAPGTAFHETRSELAEIRSMGLIVGLPSVDCEDTGALTGPIISSTRAATL